MLDFILPLAAIALFAIAATLVRNTRRRNDAIPGPHRLVPFNPDLDLMRPRVREAFHALQIDRSPAAEAERTAWRQRGPRLERLREAGWVE